MKLQRLTGEAHRAHAERLMADTASRNQEAIALFQRALERHMRPSGRARGPGGRPPCIILRTPPHTGQMEAIGRMLTELPDDGGYRRPVLSFTHTHRGAYAMAKGLNGAGSDAGRPVAGVRLTRETAQCRRLDEVNALLKAGVSPGRLCLGLDGTRCPYFEDCVFQQQRAKFHLVPHKDGVREETGHDGRRLTVPVGTAMDGGTTRDLARHADIEMTIVAPAFHAVYEDQSPVQADAAGIVLNEVSAIRWLRPGALPLDRLETPWAGAVPTLNGETTEAIALRDHVAGLIARALRDGDAPVQALVDTFGGLQQVFDALASVQDVLTPQLAADRISTRATRSGKRREVTDFARQLGDRPGAAEWHLLESLTRAIQLGLADQPERMPVALNGEIVEFGYRRRFAWPDQPVLVTDASANPTMWAAMMGGTHEIHVVDSPFTPEDLYMLGLDAVMYADHSGKAQQLLPLDEFGWDHADKSASKERDRDREIGQNRAELCERVWKERRAGTLACPGEGQFPAFALAADKRLVDHMSRQARAGQTDISLSDFGAACLTFGSVRSHERVEGAGIALVGRNEPAEAQLRQLRLALLTTLPGGHLYKSDEIACGREAKKIEQSAKTAPARVSAWYGQNRLTVDLLHEIREADLQCAVDRIAPAARLCAGDIVRVVVFGTVPPPGVIFSHVVTRAREMNDTRLAGFDGVVSRRAVEEAFAMTAGSAQNWLVRCGFTAKDHPDGWVAFKVLTGRGGRPERIWVHDTVEAPLTVAEHHASRYGMNGRLAVVQTSHASESVALDRGNWLNAAAARQSSP